jgi:hypothetical protein
MSEPDEDLQKRKYLWPWFVWPMVLLGIAIAVAAVWFNAKKIERERDFSAPLPKSAPAR